MKPSEVLIAAKKLIKNPKHWCKKCYARTRWGKEVLINSWWAYKFCAVGALIKITGDLNRYETEVYLRDCIAGISIISFNDHNSHEEVMRMFDEAIQKAISEGN